MNQRNVYDIQKDGLVVYKLNAYFEELEKAKKEYIENNRDNIMYEIICREFPSWLESKKYRIPHSQLENVGFRTESILKPVNRVLRTHEGLLNVYAKNDLVDSSILKTVYDDKTKKIMHYFLFLTEKYKSKYKTNYHGDILSLNRELYEYEVILKGLYEQLDNEELKNVNNFFELVKCGEFSYNELCTILDKDLYNTIIRRAKQTSRLVKKING